MESGPLREVLISEGRVWLRGAIREDSLRALGETTDLCGRPGQRLSIEKLGLALQPVTQAVRALLPAARAVRAVGFNKGGTANWAVPWHQDRVVAVAEKADLPDWSGWSRKHGIWHCEPPATFLDDMVFARVFLDRVSLENGGMQFAVGSHRAGLVASGEAERIACRYPIETEHAEAGDLLLLHMLTLHRSAASASNLPRRVLRIDYSVRPLPAPLEWAA